MRVASFVFASSTIAAASLGLGWASFPQPSAAEGLRGPVEIKTEKAEPVALVVPPKDAVSPSSEADEPKQPSETPAERTEPIVLVAPDEPPTTGELCAMLEAEAKVRFLPAAFFVRLIWQESHFKIKARSYKGAQGIAQFMPATAEERGLDDPYDPVQALGASAELLTDLSEQFGNVGLAAAAYNAGPGRVQRWLNGDAKLPTETLNYVKAITGRDADDWKNPQTRLATPLHDTSQSVQDWCRALPTRGMHKPQTELIEVNAEEEMQESPWGVQIAANFSKTKAQAAHDRLKKKHAKILADHEALILRRREPARGRQALYEVRVAVDSKTAGDALCSALKKDGGACTVAMN
jgi:hypothetical protein